MTVRTVAVSLAESTAKRALKKIRAKAGGLLLALGLRIDACIGPITMGRRPQCGRMDIYRDPSEPRNRKLDR